MHSDFGILEFGDLLLLFVHEKSQSMTRSCAAHTMEKQQHKSIKNSDSSGDELIRRVQDPKPAKASSAKVKQPKINKAPKVANGPLTAFLLNRKSDTPSAPVCEN